MDRFYENRRVISQYLTGNLFHLPVQHGFFVVIPAMVVKHITHSRYFHNIIHFVFVFKFPGVLPSQLCPRLLFCEFKQYQLARVNPIIDLLFYFLFNDSFFVMKPCESPDNRIKQKAGKKQKNSCALERTCQGRYWSGMYRSVESLDCFH